MEYIDKNGVRKKVPTLDPQYIIDRFEGQSKVAKYLNIFTFHYYIIFYL